MKRPAWDEYFLKIAMLVSERSTCLRHHVGAVIVKEKQILTTGYNGAVKGVLDCLSRGCLRDEMAIPSGVRHEICRAVHAEQNAVAQAAYHGMSIKDATLYCTHSPCLICAKLIVNSGIKRVCTYNIYPDNMYQELFDEAGIVFETFPKPSETINILD
ncbi:MAG: cytidine/deoxycytidylate deaminase family protein [Candidatus Margulisiibacteriota bacterium]